MFNTKYYITKTCLHIVSHRKHKNYAPENHIHTPCLVIHTQSYSIPLLRMLTHSHTFIPTVNIKGYLHIHIFPLT